MSIGLGHLYIVIGSISFLTCVVTLLVLIKKFLAQPPPSFFSYSDIIASASSAAASAARERPASTRATPAATASAAPSPCWQALHLGSYITRQLVLPEHVPELFVGEGGTRLRETIEW